MRLRNEGNGLNGEGERDRGEGYPVNNNVKGLFVVFISVAESLTQKPSEVTCCSSPVSMSPPPHTDTHTVTYIHTYTPRLIQTGGLCTTGSVVTKSQSFISHKFGSLWGY